MFKLFNSSLTAETKCEPSNCSAVNNVTISDECTSNETCSIFWKYPGIRDPCISYVMQYRSKFNHEIITLPSNLILLIRYLFLM